MTEGQLDGEENMILLHSNHLCDHCLRMSLVNGYRVKCSNYKRMGDKEKQDKTREEKLGK